MRRSRQRGFSGDREFLSNFFPCLVRYEGEVYVSVEHAYQAAKTLLPTERQYIQSLGKPGQAKRAGRILTLRTGWEEMKLGVMRGLVRYKFLSGSNGHLRSMLLGTGSEELTELNWWHDVFYGVCDGERCKFSPHKPFGENHLGRILIEVREEARMLCPRCGVGIDNDGDGNCSLCAKLSDDEVEKLRASPYPFRDGPAVKSSTSVCTPSVCQKCGCKMDGKAGGGKAGCKCRCHEGTRDA